MVVCLALRQEDTLNQLGLDRSLMMFFAMWQRLVDASPT